MGRGRDRGVAALIQAWEAGADMAVDPRRGLLVLRYCAASEEGTACETSAYRHCGESLRRASTVLREDLEMRQRYAERTRVYECADDECTHAPMMDDDYQGTLRFDARVEPPVLVEVLHIQGRPIRAQAIHDWAEQQRASHAASLCVEGSV